MKHSMHNNHRRNIYFKNEEERHRSNNNYLLSCKVSQLAELLTVVFSKKNKKPTTLADIYIHTRKQEFSSTNFS